jgi:hypothetical protein
LFEDKLYERIWAEPILNHLEQLFQTETPDEETFGTVLKDIHQRTQEVRAVNDCFFDVIDTDATSPRLCGSLAKLRSLPNGFCGRLEGTGRLQEIRNQDECTHAKIQFFLQFLKDDLSLDLTAEESIKGALESP